MERLFQTSNGTKLSIERLWEWGIFSDYDLLWVPLTWNDLDSVVVVDRHSGDVIGRFDAHTGEQRDYPVEWNLVRESIFEWGAARPTPFEEEGNWLEAAMAISAKYDADILKYMPGEIRTDLYTGSMPGWEVRNG